MALIHQLNLDVTKTEKCPLVNFFRCCWCPILDFSGLEIQVFFVFSAGEVDKMLEKEGISLSDVEPLQINSV